MFQVTKCTFVKQICSLEHCCFHKSKAAKMNHCNKLESSSSRNLPGFINTCSYSVGTKTFEEEN